MSRTTEQSLDPDRTHKAGCRDADHLWSNVSKSRLDALTAPEPTYASFDNTADGIAELAAFCRRNDVELVVMEATGGHERLAFLLLWREGLACALTNPKSVRRYAEAMGAPVRPILFLVADIARRFGQSLAEFRDRLIAAGNPKMVVRIALARNLLVRLNAKARDARTAYANAT